ncbi:TIGR02452 family protein [Lysinibacillus sp. BW-2-10]|uniref:TIGR02452 family protein n=1 Tax=Lysinibacillus sp. BW-2-10 TaxID=2590030 RepID=UPI0011815979|nr:TIGR02452 family protein [Lysinibacillus sp. BW-2-10]TSI05281.1 TIGR02452 family protein [Lysinibacillus sp. BW-2-10]
MSREKNKKIALDTLNKIKVMQKKRNSDYYSSEKLEAMKEEPIMFNQAFQTKIEVRKEDVVQTVMKEEHPIVLNFASAKNPGGGFLNGASAQEESICRASDLYLFIKEIDEFYKNPKHLKNALYDSDIIFSKNVSLIKDSNGEDLQEKEFDVITSCAVNVTALKRNNEKELLKQTTAEMKKRIENILEVAVREQAETLILGAFGCGVFGNNPYEIKQLFMQTVKNKRYNGKFKKIIISIYKDDRLFNIFK